MRSKGRARRIGGDGTRFLPAGSHRSESKTCFIALLVELRCSGVLWDARQVLPDPAVNRQATHMSSGLQQVVRHEGSNPAVSLDKPQLTSMADR
jgi:hypothetical protein